MKRIGVIYVFVCVWYIICCYKFEFLKVVEDVFINKEWDVVGSVIFYIVFSLSLL